MAPNLFALVAVSTSMTMLMMMSTAAHGQELEPRAYGIAPVGTTIVLASVGGSKGGILYDPSVAVADVQADLTIVTTGFGYTFDLAGRQARALVVVPFATGEIAGSVDRIRAQQAVSGLADPRIRFSVGLRGAAARSASELASAPKRCALGLAVTVMPPLGQYDRLQVANLGHHRWAFKPEFGLTQPLGRFTVEGAIGAWLFTVNDAYGAMNARKQQDALLSLQVHTIYGITRRIWVAFDGTGFAGGQTRIAGRVNPDEQRNTRVGGTLSLPLGRQQSVKFTYSTGATTRRGTDFDTVTVTWQLVHF
jgi:alkanesulfonate monooxygenase SsuD/methylene tetrahydromethanopterin reductase-like flavin-dependent oxidoreductase (luciferase family)